MALDRREWGRPEERRPELEAVGAVCGPAAGRLDELTRGDRGGVAHDGAEVALLACIEPQDAEAVLIVVEGHAVTRPARCSVGGEAGDEAAGADML